ncbi:hypothetical protein CMI47_19505 [Candidatus Pacearchaeota archaeon]|nr:hypothetical protein [Candidatus Pacearchaeota archaeon]
MDRFSWDPGTGVKYDILFGKDSDSRFVICWLMLGGSGGVVLAWRDNHIVSSYLIEKMNTSDADATALLLFLRTKGFSVTLPDGFDDKGRKI